MPVDVLEISADVLTGGDGSRREMRDTVPLPSSVRDAVVDLLEDLDD